MRHLVVIALLSGVASAAPLDSKLAAKVRAAGWSHASLVLKTSSGLRVVTVRKGQERHLLIITKSGALVDGGIAPGDGKLVVAEGRQLKLNGLTEIGLSYHQKTAKGGYHNSSFVWLVRESGEVACKLPGSNSSSAGSACGSGGYSEVKLRGNPLDMTIDAATSHSGTWSEPDGKGSCMMRSPVRSGPHVQRFTVPKQGTCTSAPAPKGTTVQNFDDFE